MKTRLLMALMIIIALASAVYLGSQIETQPVTADNLSADDQELTIRAIAKTMPAVVSIVIYEQYERPVVNAQGVRSSVSAKAVRGNGTGFLVSADGYILTNKHVAMVANTKNAEYKIKMASGKEYYGQFIGADPVNDLAILKIFDKNLPFVSLGTSSGVPIGTTVMAIGNVLGKYSNSVTKGIVAGRGRSLQAFDSNGTVESLENMIQTDAQINEGNSGGPLINLRGEVIGINVAMDNAGQSIGFAIPVDDARPVIESVKKSGRIIRARLGLRYIMITPALVIEKNLKQENGALVSATKDSGPAVSFGTPARKAGIMEGDIITEINGKKVDLDNSLMTLVQRFNPGDKIKIKLWRAGKIIQKEATLDEFKS